MYRTVELACLLGMTASYASALALPGLQFGERADTWGPAVSLGPSKAEIISATTTSYPGVMPPNQAGGLFIWPGMSNGTGDLIQSVIGSYVKGGSQCGTGTAADSQWCISSEVFGNDANGFPNQFIGTLQTLLANPADGVRFTYTLTDQNKYTWQQTVHNAATGALLSTFTKNSGPMLGFGTAVECQSCTPTISTQTYVNTVIKLKSADLTFPQTLGRSQGATNSAMTTNDGGITWTIALITIPAMNPAGAITTTTTKAAATTTTSKVATTTSKAGTTTAASGGSAGTVAKWGQCGGQGWTGATVCVSGSTCTVSNQWYSQCL